MAYKPRLRTVLISVNLLILVVLGGVVVMLRLYESVLIRRTESELIAQAAHVAAFYREEVRRELVARGEGGDGYGAPLPSSVPMDGVGFQPISPVLDLATHRILESTGEARAPDAPADPGEGAARGPPRAARPPDPPPDRVAAVAGGRVSDPLRDAQQVTLAGIRVIDYRGTVVATTRGEMGLSLAHREEVRRALAGERASVMYARHSDEPRPPPDSLSRGTKVRVAVAIPVIEGEQLWGAVVLSRTPMSMRQSLYRIRWYIPASIGALLAVVIFISLLTSRTIGRPMQALIAQTQRVARGEEGADRPLDKPGTHEVQQVSEAVAHMARVLQQRADYIHTFASGVSHEFKTPLTAIRGTVELLRDHLDDMTAEERERFLVNLDRDTERLQLLVTRLNDLARADVVQPGDETTQVAAALGGLGERYRSRGLALEIRGADEPVAVRMAPDLLETVLVNLLDNAQQHGNEGVRVSLRCSASLADGNVMLEVEDDGPGISESNARRVFDRFFTTARDQGGSGVGLAIVQSLVEVHGGTVELESAPGKTVFRVALPTA